MLKKETRSYELEFLMPVLGSQPSDKEIHKTYIEEKAKEEAKADDIDLNTDDEGDLLPADTDKGVTVFYRTDDGALCFLNYQVMGFIKDAINTFKEQLKIKNAASKATKFVFVSPRQLPLLRNGMPIMKPDGNCERPLRAQTAQGPRIALASSEQVNCPLTIRFSITILDNPKTGKESEPLTFEAVEEILEYGSFKGLGQWRNGSFGQFVWRRVDEGK